jgi:membrane protein DedA with SNARE-associated domain
VALPANVGYPALVLLVGGESLGLILPGETAILAAGVLARDGHLEIALVISIAAIAAIVGDNIGYLLGRRGARQLLLVRRGPLREYRARIVRDGERFFERYGGRSVFLARWVVVARMTAPWLAGASRMPMRSFFVWNALGGITWAASVALAGYVLGAAASAIFASTTVIVLVLLAALIFLSRRRSRLD